MREHPSSLGLRGLVLALLLLAPVSAAPAFATENEPSVGGAEVVEPEAGLDSIGTQSSVSQQFMPEPAPEPSALAPIKWLLLGLGIAVTVALLLLFLMWQPRFAQERRQGRTRGRR